MCAGVSVEYEGRGMEKFITEHESVLIGFEGALESGISKPDTRMCN